MDKNKSEELKEILNQKLTTEDIEKKLKEETKKTQKEEKNSINLNKLKIKDKNDDVVIPNVRNKEHEEDKESNLLLYLVSIVTLLLLALTIYLFTKDSNQINEATQNTLTKEDSNIVFEETPKIKELVKKEVSDAIKEKNIEKDEEAIKKIAIKVEKKPKELVKIKEIIKEKVVTKMIKLDKKNFKKFYNSSKYNSLKCYNFKAGDIFPDKKCKNDLKDFLKVNKNAIRFEIIPVISEDDYIIFNKLASNIKTLDKNFQKKVKEYMFKGLSRERVLETSWQVKDILGEDTILTPTNYYVKSKKNNKGVIVKAYQ